MDEAMMTTKQVADYFRVSTRTIARWVEDGTLERCKIGRLVRFKESDVAALTETGNEQNDREKSGDSQACG